MGVRYKLNKDDIKKLAKYPDNNSELFPVRLPPHEDVWVNILEVVGEDHEWVKLRLFYHDGEVIDGWTWLFRGLYPGGPVVLHNAHELFDGRFNV